MNRTLTAAVALTAGLGLAGLAQAQTSATPSTPGATPPMQTSQPSPSMSQPLPNGGNGSSASVAAPSGNTVNPSPSAMNQPGASANQPGSTAGATGSKQVNMLSQSDIQTAQQQLKAQGLYRGAIDGIIGPETEQALSQFQAKNGLPQTADLDQQTMDRLTGGPRQAQGAQQPATR